MIRKSRPILLLATFLTAFGVFGGLALSSAQTSKSVAPQARWRAANAFFEEQRYADVLEQLEGLDLARAGVEAAEVDWLRASAALRLARVPGSTGLETEPSRRTLLRLLAEEEGSLAARCYEEMMRSGYGANEEVRRHRARILEWWEARTDLAEAAPGYADLFEACLLGTVGYGTTEVPLLRMWENLVASPLSDQRLHELGALALFGRTAPLRRDRGWWGGPGVPRDQVGVSSDVFWRQVAEDLLRRDPPKWLCAESHTVLGQLAQQQDQPGVAVEHFRAALECSTPESSAAASFARDRLDEILRPSVRLSLSALFRPGSEHRIELYWRNLGAWHLRVERLDPSRALRLPTARRSGALADYFGEEKGEEVWSLRKVDSVERASRETASSPERHRQRRDEIWLDPLTPGVYRASVDIESLGEGKLTEQDRTEVVFVVSSLGVVSQTLREPGAKRPRLQLWALRMDDGRPLSKVDLQVYGLRNTGSNRQQEWVDQKLRTDEDGLALAALSADANWNGVLVVGEHDGQPLLALLGGAYHHRSDDARTRNGFVWTDRPLYRPGEPVHVQAFWRELDHDAREILVPEGLRCHVTVAGNGEVVHEAEYTLDANGSFDFDFPLPERPKLGAYGIEVKMLDGSNSVLHGRFQVDEYRLPEFTVEVALDEERRYVIGDTLQVDINAEYLFGGGVEGEAEVVVTRRPYFVFWRPWCRLPDLREASGPYRSMPIGFGQGEEILRTRVLLDASGHGQLVLPTLGRASEAQDYRYQVEARVVDASRREETGSASIPVTRQELYAFLASLRHVVAPGDPAEVRLRIQDALERPVAHSGVWTLSVTDDKREERVLRARETQTDASGEVILRFEPEGPGYYRVRFQGSDSRGHEIDTSTWVWCADPRTRRVAHGAGALQLIVEEDEFLGDTARVLLVSDTAGVSVLLTRGHVGGTESEVLQLEGTVRLIEIPLDALHRPAFELSAVRARDFRLHEARVRVVAPDASRILDLEMSFDQDEYRPGLLAPLTVRATNALGEPVQTLLSFAVVDGAVLAMMPRAEYDPAQALQRFRLPVVPRPQLANWLLGSWIEQHRDGQDVLPAPGVPIEGRLGRAGVRGGRAPEAMMAMDAVESKSSLADNAFAVPSPPDAPGDGSAVAVRSDFRTTALWRTAVATGADGSVTVDVPLPESLTKWEAKVVAIDPQTRVGTAEASARTRKPLMVRLHHPRVLREGDRVEVSATVHNETDQEEEAFVRLRAEGLPLDDTVRKVLVAAHDQTTLSWSVEVPRGAVSLAPERDEHGRLRRITPSSVEFVLTAEAASDDDGLRREVPLLTAGVPLHIAAMTEVRSSGSTLRFDLPTDRQEGLQIASLTVTPSLLATCVEALPYLAEYPYGCTEQTLSRFVPAVAVREAARALGLDPEDVDPDLDAKIREGLDRIEDMQRPDGGWGWWSQGRTDLYMTAYAVQSLARAKDLGVGVSSGMLRRGRDLLRSRVAELEPNAATFVYALHALGQADEVLATGTNDPDIDRWVLALFGRRDELRPYTRALLASLLEGRGERDEAVSLLRHIEQQVQRDTVLDTAHFGSVQGHWRRADGAVEATAFALEAYVRIDPDNPLRAQLARWLALNRRGHRWDSTRSTAHAIFALTDHLRDGEELDPDFTLIATSNGREILRKRFGAEDLLRTGGRFLFDAGTLGDGANEVRFSLEGRGTAYVALEVDTFSMSEDIEPHGNVIEISREVVRLVPRRTLGGSIETFEEPLRDGQRVESGERLRVRLKLRARHDIDYVAIEDPRPAGAEPVERLSGPFGGGGLWGQREVRDELTGFFLSSVQEGEHTLEYELRAETPGVYAQAPVRALAMYLPDIAGHGAFDHLEIVEGP